MKKRKMPKLKDCPCCGKKETGGKIHWMNYVEEGKHRRWYVLCECGMRTVLCRTAKEAGRLWNRRAPTPIRRLAKWARRRLKEVADWAEQRETHGGDGIYYGGKEEGYQEVVDAFEEEGF